ncbi:MAG: transporter substrate-binding domain-containing protein [Clostridia bacterium]|nr:transporter substrate-binding domain-containing protein [Clostridia bacterium]
MKSILKKCFIFLFLFTLLYSSFPAFAVSYGDETEKSGYSYEYLQDIANYAGWEYEYVSGGWAELYDALIKGKIDILAGISYTDERADLISYPAYEMGVESYYIYKRANDYEISGIDLSTLNGKKVGTVQNNVMTGFFEDWMKESGITVIRTQAMPGFSNVQTAKCTKTSGHITKSTAIGEGDKII